MASIRRVSNITQPSSASQLVDFNARLLPVSFFTPPDSISNQVAERQMTFGNSPRNLCTSIRSSRHKRNSRHPVFVTPAFIPETRPGCDSLTDDDGTTDQVHPVREGCRRLWKARIPDDDPRLATASWQRSTQRLATRPAPILRWPLRHGLKWSRNLN